ncbi:hypothetical protein [Streptomyces sp. enrichment culture]|uniref:hypothetical protein n=1 Tax=Streptomyces sp. enrichment culture TaxID=1795815 RepID=UPI003F565677
MPAHRDDPLRAELPRGQDREQADCAVTDDRDGPAGAASAHEAHALTLCTAEPGTAYEERLTFLASWAATGLEAADPAGGRER